MNHFHRYPLFRTVARGGLLLALGLIVPASLQAQEDSAVFAAQRARQAREVMNTQALWSGRILERMDALPVAHVMVRLLDLNGNELMRTRTRADGTYIFPAPSGSAVVEVCVPGGMVMDRIVAARSEGKDKRIKDILVDSRTRFPIFLITRDANNGRPAEDAMVTISSRNGERTILTTNTDSAGVVRGAVDGLRYGREHEVQLSVIKEGYFEGTTTVDAAELAFYHWELAGVKPMVLDPMETGEDAELDTLRTFRRP